MQRLLLCAVGLAVACGGNKQPEPPAYTPVASPEPETDCPDERDAAKLAREDLLEYGTAEAREKAAAAVFAHAECERAAIDGATVEAPTQRAMIERLRDARLLYQTAANLYAEIDNYQVLAWTVGARTRLGDLNAAFADRLRSARPPGDVVEPTERAGFLREMGEFARVYDARAAAAYREALDAAELLPSLVDAEPRLKGWVEAACRGLDLLGAKGDPMICR